VGGVIKANIDFEVKSDARTQWHNLK